MNKIAKIIITFTSLILISSFIVYGVYSIVGERNLSINNNVIFEADDVDVLFNVEIYKIKQDRSEDTILLSNNPNDSLSFITEDVFDLPNSTKQYRFAYTMRIIIEIGSNNFNQPVILNFSNINIPAGASIHCANGVESKPSSYDEIINNSIVLSESITEELSGGQGNKKEILLLVSFDPKVVSDSFNGNIGFALKASKKSGGN